jgi:hypothetical protein
MIRSPGARSSAAWVRRAVRLFADNQRLLLFACAIRLLEAAAVVPLTLVARDAFRADDLARDLADVSSRTLHLLGIGAGAATAITIAGVWLAITLVDAVLRGGLITSFRSARLTLRPPGRVVASLALFYGASYAVQLGIGALARDDRLRGLALPAAIVVAVPTLYADYAIVLDRTPLLHALAASARTVRRALVPTVAVLALIFTVNQIELSVFVDPLDSATHLLPGFLIGVLLTDAIRQFALDCSLIAAYKPDLQREPEPVTPPEE